MNKKGVTILEAIRSLRQFHAEVALLLKTADGPLEEHGWKLTDDAGDTATEDSSASVHQPAKWMPRYACRFYENEQLTDKAVFVCVVIDSLDDSACIEEPLLSAGYLQYAKEVTDWHRWYSTLAMWSPEIVLDGMPHEFEVARLTKEADIHKVTGGAALALPLVQVSTPTELKQKVVDPLVRTMAGEA